MQQARQVAAPFDGDIGGVKVLRAVRIVWLLVVQAAAYRVVDRRAVTLHAVAACRVADCGALEARAAYQSVDHKCVFVQIEALRWRVGVGLPTAAMIDSKTELEDARWMLMAVDSKTELEDACWMSMAVPPVTGGLLMTLHPVVYREVEWIVGVLCAGCW